MALKLLAAFVCSMGVLTVSAKVTALHWKSPRPKSLHKGRCFLLFPTKCKSSLGCKVILYPRAPIQ